MYKSLLQTKDHIVRTTVAASAIGTNAMNVKQVLHKAEQIHEIVKSELLKSMHDFKIRVDEQRANIVAQMKEINSYESSATDLSSAATQFVTQLVGDYEAAKYESYWGRRYAAEGRVGSDTNNEAQTTSYVNDSQHQLESVSWISEQILPVPESSTKQLLHDSSNDRNRTNFIICSQ